MNKKVMIQNRQSWDTMADTWFGSTALPEYGCLAPTETELKLFPDLSCKKALDIGCGSGHSLKWCGDNGASELWGVDISSRQIENADRYLAQNSYKAILSVSPMEEMGEMPNCVTARDNKLLLEGCSYITDEMVTFELCGNPVTIQNRKMSTWINTLAEEGFKIERIIEETSQDVLEQEYEFSESYYAPSRAKVIPLSFIIKATKL